jgi:molecular chaperone DnaK (HSP70)
VNRHSALLPTHAAADIEKISPVEASFRYLDQLAEAWAHSHAEPLAEQEIVLTVPASFDAAARDLTVEAAYAAGFENVTLLEEPQAALYAWIEASGDKWRHHLKPGDLILVIDIGGGTTDFSAIAAVERDGVLELHRVAVGDHILLGGDNMDLMLAYVVKAKLAEAGTELDAWQMAALSHACRGAKEKLLTADPPSSVPIVLPSRGSQLLGGSIRTELSRAEVESTIVEGFFPVVESSATPAVRARAGLTQLGLPYAADAAVTRHLAAFLTRQASAMEQLTGESGSSLLRPSCILFNGGVVKAEAIRERLLSTLNAWLEQVSAAKVRVLPGEDPDLAVARGAAYYGLVRSGRGLRIRGGTARAYYVGIESPMPAIPGFEPPINALCVAPFGMEEGTRAELPAHELCVVVGEPVEFRFFGSSVRRTDAAGALLEHWKKGELEELSPISVTLPADNRQRGDVVPIELRASITPIGTLLLEAIPHKPVTLDEAWKVELSVRAPTERA